MNPPSGRVLDYGYSSSKKGGKLIFAGAKIWRLSAADRQE